MASFAIGELSRRSGVHIETIRYFEKIGLLNTPPRTSGGHRVYGDKDLAAVRFIKRARTLGFSPADVRAILDLRASGTGHCDHVRKIAADHLAKVRRKIGELAELEHMLASTIQQCSGAVDDCAVIEMLSTAQG